MADDDKKAPTEPAIDMTKFEAATKAAVSAALSEAGQAAQAERQQREAQDAAARQAAATAANPDPVADVLRPHLQPLAAMLNLKAEDAKDASVFYATTPAAGKYSAAIETKFTECVQRGQPMNRASIWQWIRGSDAFLSERIKERDAELETARQAQTLQGSRGSLPAGTPSIDVNASDEDLAKSLENVQF